jgi:predicted metal-dependent phosphoesterase TrpH
MGGADLHIHSTASDGRLTPAEVVRKAAGRGLKFIALADHDSIDGIAPARAEASAFPGLKVIPGVELSTDVAEGEVHILGYFIDYNDAEFNYALSGFKNSRLQRGQKMVAKLEKLGIHIDWQRVLEIAGSSTIGRPHIAQAMLEKGYITSFKQAFDEYLGHDRPAYVARDKMTPQEAVRLIIKAGGLPVLAHPLTLPDPEGMIKELKAGGLVGIEVYYNGYTPEEVSRLLTLADKYKLVVTGGSDYHGIDSTETAIGGADVPIEAVEKLVALAQERNSKLRL